MRILIVHCAYQYRGGEDLVVEEEMKLMQQAGHTVELLLFTNKGKALLNILQLPFNFSSYRKMKRKLKEFLPDIVHLHNLHFAASPSVLYAAVHAKIPVVCTLHNYRLICPSGILYHNGRIFLDSVKQIFPWKAVQLGVYKDSKLLTFWMAVSMLIHQSLKTWRLPEKIIVLNAQAMETMRQSRLPLLNDQLVVKPNFSADVAWSNDQRGQELLFVGRLTEEKGVRLLLNYFSNSPFRITIAGDGPLKEEVRDYASKHKNITYV